MIWVYIIEDYVGGLLMFNPVGFINPNNSPLQLLYNLSLYILTYDVYLRIFLAKLSICFTSTASFFLIILLNPLILFILKPA